MNKYKGKYAKAHINQQLLIHDPPTTSVQDIICTRINDTSTDIKYPSTRFKSIRSIEDGSASIIYEGYDSQENKKVIIKKISKKEYWIKELKVLKKLSSSTSGKILKFVDFYESQRCSYIVTEYYDGFDLFEHIDINVPYPMKKGLLLILEMAKCIKECHDNNILHLDIKCENYMVKSEKLFCDEKPNIVLIDFGHAEIIPYDESIEKLRKGYSYGTDVYVCPEGYYGKIFSSKSDIWSLAVCLTLLLTSYFPFKGKDEEYYNNCTADNFDLEGIENETLINLLETSLSSVPQKRPNIDEFIRVVNYILSTI